MQRGLCYALGRRLSKTFDGTITRWVYDRNTPLHEWSYNVQDKPQAIIDDTGQLHWDKPEPTENIITWVFEEGSFKPAAKLINNKRYSIICDYLGTPVEMYDEFGTKTWECELDIYGRVKQQKGEPNACPFRYQGQYEDVETGLYYNRFRYYSSEEGLYISQDPIKLVSGEPNLYAYVHDLNSWVDIFGLNQLDPIIFHSTGGGVIHPGTISQTNPHGVFTIDATGSYIGDRAAIVDKANISNPGKDYHAHHIDYNPKDNTMRMQLVHKDYHGTHPHIGGADDFKKHTGFKYGSDDAIAEARKRNKGKIKKCK